MIVFISFIKLQSFSKENNWTVVGHNLPKLALENYIRKIRVNSVVCPLKLPYANLVAGRFSSPIRWRLAEENNHPGLSEHTADHCGVHCCRVFWILIKQPFSRAAVWKEERWVLSLNGSIFIYECNNVVSVTYDSFEIIFHFNYFGWILIISFCRWMDEMQEKGYGWVTTRDTNDFVVRATKQLSQFGRRRWQPQKTEGGRNIIKLRDYLT